MSPRKHNEITLGNAIIIQSQSRMLLWFSMLSTSQNVEVAVVCIRVTSHLVFDARKWCIRSKSFAIVANRLVFA